MSEYKLDHSQEDVLAKLESQRAYLPERLGKDLKHFLTTQQPQMTLNELFHLLKKYDLASEDDQAERNHKLQQMIG